MLRITYCLDNLLTDGNEFVSLTRRPCSTSQKLFFPGTNMCYRLSKPQSLVFLEWLGKLKRFYDLIGSRTRDLPSCSIVHQPIVEKHSYYLSFMCTLFIYCLFLSIYLFLFVSIIYAFIYWISCFLLYAWFFALLILLYWTFRRHSSPKRRWLSTDSHCYIPEHRTLHIHRCENLKLCIRVFITLFVSNVISARNWYLLSSLTNRWHWHAIKCSYYANRCPRA
jgi:hypothetical protein